MRVVRPLDPPRSSGGFDEGAPAPTFEFSEPPRTRSTSVTTAGLGNPRSGPAPAVLPRALRNSAQLPAVTENLRRRFGLATSLLWHASWGGRTGLRLRCGGCCTRWGGAGPARPLGGAPGQRRMAVGRGRSVLRDHRLHDTPGQPSARVTAPSLARGLLAVERSRGPSSLCRPKLRKSPGRRAVAGRYYPSKPRRV